MSSARKYWTTEQLHRDIEYWTREEIFANRMIKLTWDRSGYQSPRWSLAKNKAVQNRRASEAFLAQRQVPA
ncbi:MAG: hypothetical protein E5V40_04415 [Mesorhizobium sp.]|nr:MAG: hypothetical protein E5V40_04415 [Mesorhizobium sp.]